MRTVDPSEPRDATQDATPPPAHELLAQFGSPLYVYDAGELDRAYGAFVGAFAYRPLDVHYAIVCNSNGHLVRRLLSLGAGVHANTPGDAHCAMAAGVPAERIVYSGTNLSADDFRFLLEHRIALNLDSLDQLRTLEALRRGAVTPDREVRLGLRLLVDDPTRANRIGVTISELEEALSIAARGGMRLTGLHMYAGTNTRRMSRFLECFERLAEASRRLPDLVSLDVGGGFGIAYQESQHPLDLATLGRDLSNRMAHLSEERGRGLRLAVEPGRILVGRAGSLLTRVVSVKERGGRRFVGVDTTVGNLVVPSVYHPHHTIRAETPRGEPLAVPTDVCGNTTHSRDYLARGVLLPSLQPGDILRILDVGAYGYAMSSHFLNRPRPAEVMVEGAVARLTTRRETFDDLVATGLAP